MALDDDYRRALDAAVREYETLTADRAKLDERIARLAQTIGTLTRLCGLVPTVPWGLADACRMVLKAAGHPLTAVEIRAQLEALGFDLTRYTNELAAIHTTLKRLNDSGDTQLVPRAWNKPAYAWIRASGRSLVVHISEAEAQHIRDHATNLEPPFAPPPSASDASAPEKPARSRRKR